MDATFKQSTVPKVISASRRTDIPAFYMKWFMEQIKKQHFKVVNPFNNRVSIVPVTPENTHTIVFWSKDFTRFIRNDYGKQLNKLGFNLFFNFTLNSESKLLEPNVPLLKERFSQLESLCRNFGPSAVTWRFDPICHYSTQEGEIFDNLKDFQMIADKAADLEIKRCITSFMDFYPKINRRIKALPGFSFLDPPLDKKIRIILGMEKTLLKRGIRLYACCEKQLLENLPDSSKIEKSSCIPNKYLVQLFGGNLSFKRDKGQRTSQGCGCRVSRDIGSYHLHPCYNNCLFCYANPIHGKPYKMSLNNKLGVPS